MSSNKTNRKRFFILDGYALLYRAHFALIRNPLITSYGLHTSALFGFANQVLKLIKSENPDYIACAFDSKEKTFRHDMYKEYKANRSPMPDEMQLQLPHLWEMLEAMNLPVLKKPGVEADDIIGTLAVQAEKEGLDTYIVSGDKDFMQLMNDHIFMFAPGTRKTPHPIIYNSAKVEEKWGVPPNKIIDLLGLMGDSSDNVPGVAGVGEKTAVKLIKSYGSLEGALENADKVTNKRAHNGLKDGVENAILSKELVTILTDVELSCSVGELEKRDINIDACADKFTELEFHALLKQLVAESNVEVKIKKDNVEKNYNTILTEKSLNDLVKSLKISKWFSFALETTSIHAMKADIVGLSFSNKADSGWYVPIQYLEKENILGAIISIPTEGEEYYRHVYEYDSDDDSDEYFVLIFRHPFFSNEEFHVVFKDTSYDPDWKITVLKRPFRDYDIVGDLLVTEEDCYERTELPLLDVLHFMLSSTKPPHIHFE